jgi:phosphopentomutase
MTRAALLVLDSVGIGGAPDAHAYGDGGADTVGHIAEACARGEGDAEGLREGPLSIPNLAALGLGGACGLAIGRMPPGLEPVTGPIGRFGSATEISRGKNTPSGHWELACVPVPFEWGLFPDLSPAFPPDLVATLCDRAGLSGILGNCHASGTAIIERHGREHMRTGRPICYTSADSVFQIAAHEESFGLERLYRLCEVARELVNPYRIGRVIARPFIGSDPTSFERTPNRRDYAIPPHTATILDRATAEGRDVTTVGKIADIFAGRGTGRVLKADGNAALFKRTLEGFRQLEDGGFLFANFIDFDGHRRDVVGYAAALEEFDRRLPELFSLMGSG